MYPFDPLVRSAVAVIHARLAQVRTRRLGESGEIVTWVILAAGLALVAVAVVLIIGAKLRDAATGIELQ
jgi:hypothetical protein